MKYPIVNILYQPGFYGNFLRFVCEKFSKLTRDIDRYPFLPNGTAHNYKEIEWSGMFTRHHLDYQPKDGDKVDPICLIKPCNLSGRVLSKTLQLHRAGKKEDRADIDDLFKFRKSKLHQNLQMTYDHISKFYKIAEHDCLLPKYLVRDWFKLEWLGNERESYDYKFYNSLLNSTSYKKQKIYIFPLEAFLKWKDFRTHLVKLDKVFSMNINFDRGNQIEDLFQEGLSLDRERCSLGNAITVIDSVKKLKNIDIPNLNVVLESFILSEIEKDNLNFIFPMTNTFYSSTKEIIDLIKYFPNYYKMPNPHYKNER